MRHLPEDAGSPCPDCGHTIVLHDYGDIEPYTACSEFCERVSNKEIETYKNAKPGDFCVFPCSECGEPIEDEWQPNEHYGCLCTKCYPKVQLRERTELLKEARTLLANIADPKVYELIRKIDAALK